MLRILFAIINTARALGEATVATMPTLPPAQACPVEACTACSMHGLDAPRLYTVQRHDGIGGSLLLALPAMGFAETQGWNYGGALSAGHAVVHNHHDEVACFVPFQSYRRFGAISYKPLLTLIRLLICRTEPRRSRKLFDGVIYNSPAQPFTLAVGSPHGGGFGGRRGQANKSQERKAVVARRPSQHE